MRPVWVHTRVARGYILVEAVVAMTVLGIVLISIHNATRQAQLTRAQARDYTHARFLLDSLAAEAELTPALEPGTESGRGGPDRAFTWRRTVELIPLDIPPGHMSEEPRRPAQGRQPVLPPTAWIGRVRIEVTWTRMGRAYAESLETLFRADRFAGGEEESDDDQA